MAEAPASPRTMHVDGFVDAFVRIDKMMVDRRFAFVLGAGASRSSGIKTGGEFVREWLEILYRRDPERGGLDLEGWLAETRAGIDGFDPARAAEFYPQVYAETFRADPAEGYACLEKAMAGAEPAYGYAVLADLLERTRHKAVITTNFDNLVADALANFASTFPLVCGHDSLAGFAQPNLRRPLILKVHHDLLFAPRSRPEEVGRIGDGYREAVARLLQHYTPIVLGYGGNDGSLMGVLEGLAEGSVPGGIYWCYRAGDGPPREEIRRVVGRQHGWLVPILGFDEVMAMLADRLEFDLPDARIKERAASRARRLVEQATELNDRLAQAAAAERTRSVARDFISSPLGAPSEPALAAAASEALRSTLERGQSKRRWWRWIMEAKKFERTDPDRAEALYQEALRELPGSSELLGNYAGFLWKERKDLARARDLYEKALLADPQNAINLGNYANLLWKEIGEPARAQELYERALAVKPRDVINLGNYANFLRQERGEPARARELYERALEADPQDAITLGNFAGLLLAQGEAGEGVPLLQRAHSALSTKAGSPGLELRVEFYAYAHVPEQYPNALADLKRRLLELGARSPHADLAPNVERAVRDRHPEAAWIPRLAEVIEGKAEPEALEGWEAWRQAA